MRTIDEVLAVLPKPPLESLAAPSYAGASSLGAALAVESMKRLTTDEGWQIMAGLEHAGYTLCGRRLSVDKVCVGEILDQVNPGVVVVQDKCQWHGNECDFRDQDAWFVGLSALRCATNVFKLAILKDAQQLPYYHKSSAAEIGAHAWIVYYNAQIVQHLAPYVRPQHLIRTHHSVDPNLVPPYSKKREGCVLSGAVSTEYPFRKRLLDIRLPGVTYLKHPGYKMSGCATPAFLDTLSQYKVAICTSSKYGYALRKIIEASACGCVVVTDLPVDEVLPAIDGNLVRVHPNVGLVQLADLLQRQCELYDADRQQHYAERATAYYDYRAVGRRLATDIEAMRLSYSANDGVSRDKPTCLGPVTW